MTKNFKNHKRKKTAFSLIELSIVLIIIGLLIAGVTGGASLIKSSELRSIMSEARAFATAVNGFYNQFNYLPGDYNVAIAGSEAGNANGNIEYFSDNDVNEGRIAWFQMRSAGIIDASIVSGSPATSSSTVPAITAFGVKVPKSKIKNSGWDFDYNSDSVQNVVVLTGPISAGSATNTLVNGSPVSSVAITSTDALSIDSKIDDGVPSAGKIRGVNPGVTNDCYSTLTAYKTGSTAKSCALSYQIDINS